MDWSAATRADPRKLRLAQALVAISARRGWGRGTFEAAAAECFGSPGAWREVFPGGAGEAIWFISEVSDASMGAAFEPNSADGMAEVIGERLAQNAALKRFVARVMMFDLRHPVQGVRRMQRTARCMAGCLARAAPIGGTRLAALNLAYTGLVMLWLADRSRGERITAAATRRLMRLLRL
jgi:hypothetical protein